MTRVSALVAIVAIVVLLGACAGSAPAVTSPSTGGDPKSEEIDKLRRQQLDLLYKYDLAMSHGEDGCKDLCAHHSSICSLADRICAIADKHPEHPRALASCRQANETCADVTARLPQACWCAR